MFDKIRYALTLFDSKEILLLFVGLVIYHAVILLCTTLSIRSSPVLYWNRSWRGRRPGKEACLEVGSSETKTLDF